MASSSSAPSTSSSSFHSWQREEKVQFLQFCFPLVSRDVLSSFLDEHSSAALLNSDDNDDDDDFDADIIEWIMKKQRSSSPLIENDSTDHLVEQEEAITELTRIFPKVPQIREIFQENQCNFYETLECLLTRSSSDNETTTVGPATCNNNQDVQQVLREIQPDLTEDEAVQLLGQFNGDIEAIDRHLETQKLAQNPMISQLQDIFPDLALTTLGEALQSAGNNVETAIAILCSQKEEQNLQEGHHQHQFDHPLMKKIANIFPHILDHLPYLAKLIEWLQGDEEKIIEWLLNNPVGSFPQATQQKRNRKKRSDFISIPADFVFDKDDRVSLLQPGVKLNDVTTAKRDPNVSYARAVVNEKKEDKAFRAIPVDNSPLTSGSSGGGFWGNDPNSLRNSASSYYSSCKTHFQKAMDAYRRGKHGKSIAAYYANLVSQGVKHGFGIILIYVCIH